MLEIMKTIAILCAVHSTGQYGSAGHIDEVQRGCQADLVYCETEVVEKGNGKVSAESALANCVVKRALDNGWRPKKL